MRSLSLDVIPLIIAVIGRPSESLSVMLSITFEMIDDVGSDTI
jgi:hypothetical protein